MRHAVPGYQPALMQPAITLPPSTAVRTLGDANAAAAGGEAAVTSTAVPSLSDDGRVEANANVANQLASFFALLGGGLAQKKGAWLHAPSGVKVLTSGAGTSKGVHVWL
jgi:hypothetical protein